MLSCWCNLNGFPCLKSQADENLSGLCRAGRVGAAGCRSPVLAFSQIRDRRSALFRLRLPVADAQADSVPRDDRVPGTIKATPGSSSHSLSGVSRFGRGNFCGRGNSPRGSLPFACSSGVSQNSLDDATVIQYRQRASELIRDSCVGVDAESVVDGGGDVGWSPGLRDGPGSLLI